MAGGLTRVLRAPFGPAEAYLRMAIAVAEDLVGAVVPGGERDPFLKRDPGYIERTLPALRMSSELYFRADVRGLGHIPPEGPVLLVGNHSGGTWIADTFIFTGEFYDHFGPERRFHQLAHDVAARMPATGLGRSGTVADSLDDARKAFDRGAPVLVYPG